MLTREGKKLLSFCCELFLKLIRQYLMKNSYFAINANVKKVFIGNQRDENPIKEKMIFCARRFSFDIFRWNFILWDRYGAIDCFERWSKWKWRWNSFKKVHWVHRECLSEWRRSRELWRKQKAYSKTFRGPKCSSQISSKKICNNITHWICTEFIPLHLKLTYKKLIQKMVEGGS